MIKFNLDLHIHSVLSPCADFLMTPLNIINKAKKRGLDIIAITDHNSAKNLEVALKIAKKKNIIIIPGMEVESAEEVHLLTYFPTLERVMQWQKIVYKNLPDKENDEEFFGYQIITNEKDEYLKKEKRLLATATELSINEIVNKVKKLKGIVVPSHIFRTNGLIKNLGFIPEDSHFKLLELSKLDNMNKAETLLKKFNNNSYSFVKNSDSHYLKDIKITMNTKLKKYDFDKLFENLSNKNFYYN
ncbi:MAG: PHP domain-containing protein [Bacillota bacterium]